MWVACHILRIRFLHIHMQIGRVVTKKLSTCGCLSFFVVIQRVDMANAYAHFHIILRYGYFKSARFPLFRVSDFVITKRCWLPRNATNIVREVNTIVDKVKSFDRIIAYHHQHWHLSLCTAWWLFGWILMFHANSAAQKQETCKKHNVSSRENIQRGLLSLLLLALVSGSHSV